MLSKTTFIGERASLSPEKESVLWKACGQGDESARESLILAYRPMVYWLARQFHIPYAVYPDLTQEGMLALISAVDRFDVSRNNRFSTYAYYRIRGQMVNYLQRVEAKAPSPVEDEYLEKECVSYRDADAIENILTIESGIRQLSKREAEIVDALLLKGRKAQEVALEKKLDVSYIYKLQKRALAQLKAWFEKEANATEEL